MSKMKAELERLLDENKYELWEVCKTALEFFTMYDIHYKVISGLSLQLNDVLSKIDKGDG